MYGISVLRQVRLTPLTARSVGPAQVQPRSSLGLQPLIITPLIHSPPPCLDNPVVSSSMYTQGGCLNPVVPSSMYTQGGLTQPCSTLIIDVHLSIRAAHIHTSTRLGQLVRTGLAPCSFARSWPIGFFLPEWVLYYYYY